MAKICITKVTAEKLKEGFRSGDITVAGLYEMNSAGRRALFEDYVSSELAHMINASFEKAMTSKRQDSLTQWAKGVFKPSERGEQRYKTVAEKIKGIEEAGPLTGEAEQNFLEDLVADRLGVSVTADEVKTITEKADALDAEFQKETEDGLPTVEYWAMRNDMEKYLDRLTPTSRLKVATSIAGRGAMLLSLKSPLTNIISNTAHGLVQAMERRFTHLEYRGLNEKFSLAYVKKVNIIYQKSGYDISRMESLNEGQRRRGEEITTTEGPGAVRAIGRWYEDIVFKQLMGAPDVVASSIAFADSVDIASSEIALTRGLRGDEAKQAALDMFKDAIRITPLTVDGEILRSHAIADARYSTYTNKSGYSDLAMAIRSALNNATGDLRLGDQLMPFVKTPANVVQAGVDAAGLGAFRGFHKLPEAMRQLKAGNKVPMQEAVRLFVRSGLGFTLSVVLAFMFDPDDFIGDYEAMTPKGRQLVRLKNAPFNSIKVGDKYISLDYMGPLGAPFVGLMYARKYGENLPEKIYHYARGVSAQALKVPGLREFTDLVEGISRGVAEKELAKVGGKLSDEVISYIRARTVPAIVYDFAKGIDPVQRSTSRDELAKVKATIPGVRQGLPARVEQTTGAERKGEGFISTVLFGSRVKTATENKIVKEIDRLAEEGQAPSVGNLEYTSGRVKELREQIGGERFQEAVKFFGKSFGETATQMIGGGYYRNSSDEGKKNILNEVRRRTINTMLARFNYKPAKPRPRRR